MRALNLKPILTASLCLFLTNVCFTQGRIAPDDLRVIDPGGATKTLQLEELDIFGPSLRKQFPDLHTFRVKGGDITGVVSTFDGKLLADLGIGSSRYTLTTSAVSPDAIPTMVINESYDELELVDAVCGDNEGGDLPLTTKSLDPLDDIDGLTVGLRQRTYRIVIAPTLEFVRFNDKNNESAMLVIANTIAYADRILRRDLAVNLELVRVLTYEDKATQDDFVSSPDGKDNRLDLAASVIAKNFNPNSFDLGMVFHNTNLNNDLPGGSVANVGVVCSEANQVPSVNSPKKGAGWSGSGNNTAPEWNRFVVHELGHMFGARHTFNGLGGSCDVNVSATTAVEIGSGTTIMGYYGLCNEDYNIPIDVAANDYFHQLSIAEMATYLNDVNCGAPGTADNSPPMVEADPCQSENFTIPKGTAFLLRGEATDVDDDRLSYSWEQLNEDGTSNPSQGATLTRPGTNGLLAANSPSAPLFRNFAPTDVPVRRFPSSLDGRSTEFEVLPQVARTLRFGFVARDNAKNTGGLSVNTTEVNISSQGPLVFDGPNTPSRLMAGNTYDFTWEPNQTEDLCDRVTIAMSLDGGLSYPYTLGEADYSEKRARLSVPAAAKGSDEVRFRLSCEDSPCRSFYAVDQTVRSVDNDACSAISSMLPEEAPASFSNQRGSVDLNLTQELVESFDGTISGTINDRSEKFETSFYRNSDRADECSPVRTESSTDVVYVSTTVSGEYRISISAPNTNDRFVVTAYRDVFKPKQGCTNWINATRATGSRRYEDNLTIPMQAGEQYVFTIAALSQEFIDRGLELDYDLNFFKVNGEGQATYTNRPLPPANYDYTYLAVEEPTSVIRDVDDNANFEGLPSGSYEVYGLSYPTDVDDNKWVGRKLSRVLATGSGTECLALSDNFRSVNVVSEQVVAPVEWLTFTAFHTGTEVVLNWSVATEVDNDYFAVQRSVDGYDWETIGTVGGRGTARDRGDYGFTDSRPLPGSSYYRLTQVDYDGSSSVSSVVTVNGPVAATSISVFPNPFQSELTVIWGGSPATSPEVYDVTGRNVSASVDMDTIANTSLLSTPRLPAGIYFIRWGGESVRVVKR